MANRIVKVASRPLAYSLRALARAGERLPSVEVGRYTVALDTSSGRLYVRSPDSLIGVLIPQKGIFRVRSDATKVDIASVKVLVEKFVDVAAGAAALMADSPRCAVCGRPLGATAPYKTDRARGIGRVCWEQGEFATFERRTSAGRTRPSKIRRPLRK